MPRGINLLTAKAVEKMKEPGRHADGGGLYLEVDQVGGKRWVLRYQLNGKRRDMGLGGLDKVSLALARDKRDEAKALAGQGIDPIEDRRAREAEQAAQRAVPFFGAFATEVIDGLVLKREQTRDQWRQNLGPDTLPSLQKLRVDEITADIIVAALKADWARFPVKMPQVRARIEHVLDVARARGFTPQDRANPARWKGHIEVLLGKPRHKVTHFRAMPYEQVGDAFVHLRAAGGMRARLVEFAALCAVRPSEARLAQVRSFDLDEAVWVVTDDSLKNEKHLTERFVIPLSSQAVALLRGVLRPDAKPTDCVFGSPMRGRKGKPLHRKSPGDLLEEIGLGEFATSHGFRSTFRDWAGDCTEHSREVVEQCLGHKVGNAAERAYRRRDALEKRRVLMQDWADRCGDPSRDKVVPLLKRKAAA